MCKPVAVYEAITPFIKYIIINADSYVLSVKATMKVNVYAEACLFQT